jgi:hypothetical protein
MAVLTAGGRVSTEIIGLPGSPDQFADALALYHLSGIDNFIITGSDRDITPCIGAEIASRLRQACEKAHAK